MDVSMCVVSDWEIWFSEICNRKGTVAASVVETHCDM